MTFECMVKQGHAGAGKYSEKKIFIYADDIISAMNKAKNSGGVKKGRAYNAGQSIVSIKRVN
jgi:nucleoside-diphosphate-sugar epimerase